MDSGGYIHEDVHSSSVCGQGALETLWALWASSLGKSRDRMLGSSLCRLHVGESDVAGGRWINAHIPTRTALSKNTQFM